jgi:hypothetical protein
VAFLNKPQALINSPYNQAFIVIILITSDKNNATQRFDWLFSPYFKKISGHSEHITRRRRTERDFHPTSQTQTHGLIGAERTLQ